jgi:homoserine kinase
MPRTFGPRAVVVRAPATSANLGPGFDCLGLALDLWSDVTGELVADSAIAAPADENLVVRAARRVFDEVGQPLPDIHVASVNRIPFSRGLGSSAAAIVSGALLANRLLGDPLGETELLALAIEMEGHPDNVVPCLLGGVRAVALDGEERVLQSAVPLPRPLVAAVFIPEVHVPTQLARAALPTTVSFSDALFNVSRAALLVAALASGDYPLLRDATGDRLHQPYRAPLFPAMTPLIEAALDAGALGAYSSGAGSSILALSPSAAHADTVCLALTRAAEQCQVPGSTLTVGLSAIGAHVVNVD